MKKISYSDLSEERPKRDRRHAVQILRSFIPHDLIDAYLNERSALLGGRSEWRSGWSHATPYLEVESMRNIALYPPLMEKLEEEVGERMGLHLTLTGFQSTQRRWHSDSYLNPPFVGDKYLAVWFALGDIHPDSGPYEWVQDSEKWPVITRDKVWSFLTQDQITKDNWPTISQDFVAKACEAEIARRGSKINQFIAGKGDVLIWDSDLIHQGSNPNNPDIERPALIAHYSALSVRHDMPQRRRDQNGQSYFYFDHQTQVR